MAIYQGTRIRNSDMKWYSLITGEGNDDYVSPEDENVYFTKMMQSWSGLIGCTSWRTGDWTNMRTVLADNIKTHGESIEAIYEMMRTFLDVNSAREMTHLLITSDKVSPEISDKFIELYCSYKTLQRFKDPELSNQKPVSVSLRVIESQFKALVLSSLPIVSTSDHVHNLQYQLADTRMKLQQNILANDIVTTWDPQSSSVQGDSPLIDPLDTVECHVPRAVLPATNIETNPNLVKDVDTEQISKPHLSAKRKKTAVASGI